MPPPSERGQEYIHGLCCQNIAAKNESMSLYAPFRDPAHLNAQHHNTSLIFSSQLITTDDLTIHLTIQFITIHNGTLSTYSTLYHATKQAFIFKCYPLIIIITIIITIKVIVIIIITIIITTQLQSCLCIVIVSSTDYNINN